MRVRSPDLPRQFKTPMVPLVPILGIIVCAAMIYGLDWPNWTRLIGWLAIGMVIYFRYGVRNSRLQRAAAVSPARS
jgi:APA family basic amino acid/polyamine antiporter